MFMDFKKIKIITIVLSLVLFGISLTQNAIVKNYNDEISSVSSLEFFFMGSTAFIGGGLLEQIIWLANPLSLFAIIYLFKDNRKTIILSLIASVLAVSFSFWSEILGAESGSMAKIVSLESGYYLWLSSIFTLTIGILIYYKVSLKSILQS